MERWPEAIYEYIGATTRVNDPVLLEMEERAKREHFPIVGPLTGPWLYLLARLINARHVFEMGSGFGYSTWYLATALRDNGGGTVVHTVWDADLSRQARDYLERAGLAMYCDFQISESILALEAEQPGLDLVFLDIDKEDYFTALKVIEQRLRPGGLLLVDNVLRGGRVTDDADHSEPTEIVRTFNRYLRESPKWDYLINPLRDGLGVAQFTSHRPG